MAIQQSPVSAAMAGAASTTERHGYELPEGYSSVDGEYTAATTAAGVHDASYLGRLKATGEDALDLLNRLSTNKVIDLQAGQGAPTVLTTDRGRIVDLLGVVNTGEHVLLLTSPGRQQPVIDWLDRYTIMEDLVVEDVSGDTAMLMVIGPAAAATLGFGRDADDPDDALQTAFSAREQIIGGEDALVIAGPMGKLPCYYVVSTPEAAANIWPALLEAGATPVGIEALEAVRVRQGVPAFGSEMGEPYNPLEAGLIGSVDFAKGCYIGQEVIARLDSYNKVQKYLVALTFEDGAPVSAGDALLQGGQPVGQVTSVSRIPGAGLSGLGYVKTASALAGGRLELESPSDGSAGSSVEIKELAQLFGPGQEF